MMILHMDDNILLWIEMLSFLIMILFILFHFRGVPGVFDVTVIPGGVPGVFDVTVIPGGVPGVFDVTVIPEGVSKVLLMYQKCILRDSEVLYLYLTYQRCL